MTISCWFLLRMNEKCSKRCTENKNTRFMFSNFFPKNRAVYEIMSKSVVEHEGPQMAMWLRAACLISKATRAHAHPSTHAPPHAGAYVHALTRARTDTHSQTEICNTYCFSTATMVSWTLPIVTLYVNCLSFFVFCSRSSNTRTLLFNKENIPAEIFQSRIYMKIFFPSHCFRLRLIVMRWIALAATHWLYVNSSSENP